ncbi:MAG: glutamate ligase domain-containing protein [Kiritimatiellia bacterium]
MGIGGVGMAGLAYLLGRNGHTVTGCDRSLSPRTHWLEKNGIPVALGHSSAHLDGVDELIVTPAIPQSAPELAAARSRGICVRFRGAVLADLVNAAYGVAVCGTHGKTTTSTFATKLLRALGDAPAWCIGGETGAMPVAGGSPHAAVFVVEADESDGTLALYRPHILVLNAVDFDHLEHFASPEAYFDCYRTAIRNTTETVIVCAEHSKALALTREAVGPGVRLVTFGLSAAADVSAAQWPQLASLVLGRHNVLNALAAIAVARSRGHSDAVIAAALPSAVAELPDRRFQTVATASGVTVLTDYAHHPAELACAVDMARQLKPKRLRVLFQPHRHSRTKALLAEFPPAFDAADEVVLIPVYAAFEQPIPGGDIADLYKAFRDRPAPQQQRLLLARSADEAWRHVHLTAEPGDLVLLAGAGDIINLLPRVKRDMTAPRTPASEKTWTPLAPLSFFRTGGATCGGGRPVVVGMGSNTWFSDCADDCEIVKPPLPVGAALLPAHPELAFMAGIPGTVGGWVKMNAGAFGHSISEAIRRVKVDGVWKDAAACEFGYRTSSISGVIEAVEFKAPAAALDTREAYLARRRAFPPRTCGSVFRNPSPDMPAGRLLEAAGAKELRVGGASVWREHANVIVAGEGCTSSDILALTRLMAAAVREKFHIDLRPEISGLVV